MFEIQQDWDLIQRLKPSSTELDAEASPSSPSSACESGVQLKEKLYQQSRQVRHGRTMLQSYK